MLAVKGMYDDGKIILKGNPPVKTAEVIVVFPDSEEQKKESVLSAEKKRELFEEFSGSVNRVIDIKAERMEALDKKYADID